jgi:hypothetical protein
MTVEEQLISLVRSDMHANDPRDRHLKFPPIRDHKRRNGVRRQCDPLAGPNAALE